MYISSISNHKTAETCLERWAITLEINKICPKQQHRTGIDLRKMLSCNGRETFGRALKVWGTHGRSPASVGRDPPQPTGLDFACPTCPGSPDWQPTSQNLHVWALGLLPTANLRRPRGRGGPMMAMVPQGLTLPWGRAPCPPSSPAGQSTQPQHGCHLHRVCKLCAAKEACTGVTRRARWEQTVALCFPGPAGGTLLLWVGGGERTVRSPQHNQGCFLAVRLG